MSNSGAANQIQDRRAARLIQGQTKAERQQKHCSGDPCLSLINSRSAQHAPAVAADLQGRGKAAICPPPRAKPRAKMEAVAKPALF